MKNISKTLMLSCLLFNPVVAEVILDGSFSSAKSGAVALVDNQYTITEAQGDLRGSNLFQSFSEFNVEAENTAVFTGPSSVQNIISRVTGGNASAIDGTIRSEISGANLWLINPDGILFGDGARVDVQGSFLASTADYVLLNDGETRFYADANRTDILIASPPKTFGFLSDSFPLDAKIDIGNTQISVPENESISILSSDVSVKGALLAAPGGVISVVSINEAGEVIYSDQQGLDVSSIENFGSLSINSTFFIIDGQQEGIFQIKGGEGSLEFSSIGADLISSVTSLKTSFVEAHNLMEAPCELVDFYNQGKMSFTVKQDDEETEYGVKTKKTHRGPIGGIESVECL